MATRAPEPPSPSSTFFASLDLSPTPTHDHKTQSHKQTDATPPDNYPRTNETQHQFLLDAREVLAHLQYLAEAFAGVTKWNPASDRHFLLYVEGAGKYIVSFLPKADPSITVAPSRASPKELASCIVSVVPFDDMPEDLRPNVFASSFTCTPSALITLLSGGAAALMASYAPSTGSG